MLYPFYPYNREEELYKKIQKLLRPSYKVTRKEEIQTKIEEILKSHESVFNDLIDGHRVVVTLIKDNPIQVVVTKHINNDGRKSGIRIIHDGQTDIFLCQEALPRYDYVLHKHAKNEVLKKNRKQQIIDALRLLRGYAKLEDLYKIVDTSTWGTKTPKASIRQILQLHQEFFNIRSGVWGLEECRNQIEIQIKQGNI